MCGFVCVFQKKPVIANRDYFGAVTMMLKSISHRGPDDQKIYSNPTQGLHIGFCRLSMVDVKMSMQPFWDTNERTAVIFNGEIYNYKSLRKEVGETTFGTLGEVELILQLYKMYGESFIEKLDGMFAICIIDLLKGKVFAVRDKQGIKPLYYYEDEYAYILASELKAIRTVYPLEINPLAIEMYLSFRFIPAPYSIYKKVSKLKAGEQITFYRDGEISKKCYVQYNTDFSQRLFNADECRNVLKRNIDSTFDHGEVPVGLFLSGGIDSGIIAAILKDRLKDKGSTYHIEYSYDRENNPEENVFKLLVSQLGIDCGRIVFNDAILNNIDRIVFALDEPFYSTVSASTYSLSFHAKKTVKGVLTGDGSDELIYGYKYLRNAINQKDPYEAYRNGIGWLKYIDYRSLLDSCSLHSDDISHFLYSDCCITGNILETLRRVEVFKRLPDYHLMRVDRLTMAFGLEARLPYLRSECVDMFLSINGDYFIQSEAKSPLKEAFSSSLPSVLLSSKKQPFYAPVKKWIENTLQQDIQKTFCNKEVIKLLGLNFKAVNRMLYMYDGSYAAVSNIWGMYLLLKWGQTELDRRQQSR